MQMVVVLQMKSLLHFQIIVYLFRLGYKVDLFQALSLLSLPLIQSQRLSSFQHHKMAACSQVFSIWEALAALCKFT